MITWKSIGIGAALAVLLVLAYVYRGTLVPYFGKSEREQHIAVLETKVSGLLQQNEKIAKDIGQAKARAEAALLRARSAEQRAASAEAVAAVWRSRHDKLVEERARLAKITSNQEALIELRRLGWVRWLE